MIDPKYTPRIKDMLVARLKREPSQNEIINALNDTNLGVELLLTLQDEQRTSLANAEANIQLTLNALKIPPIKPV